MLGIVLDGICIFLVLMAIWGGLRRGFLISVYNLLSIIFISLSVLHIYPKFTTLVKMKVPVLPEGFGDFVSVGILFLGFMMIARLFRELLVFFLVIPEVSGWEKFVALILSTLTGIISASMFMFWIYLSPWEELAGEVENGRISRYLYILPAEMYTFTCDTLIRPYFKSRFLPNDLVYLGNDSRIRNLFGGKQKKK